MWFLGSEIGHKSTYAATDHFLRDRDHLNLDINRQHDIIDNYMDWKDEADDGPIVEGHVLDSDDDYGYGDLLDEIEGIVSDNLDNNDSSERDGALIGSS